MSGELPVIAKLYEVVLWTLPRLAKLPRTHRFLAGDRVATGLYRLLESLVRAQSGSRRRDRLAEASASPDLLRLEVRLLGGRLLSASSRQETPARNRSPGSP